ncbi:MAG: tetratricopeptide repeat protein [Desulfuromonadales bacterium]|uniref:tetratricopeptide repeat protein n=1 Tax=Desulfuromonas sp. KJ2020 TaxID=2919173 RepID=UPI0020A6DEEC|nr:hypothetical protein [Desulfuromonas sp. KJ2020]MCP3176797.1 hypothetical protein [Desulfuromonas sp. KJ2020]
MSWSHLLLYALLSQAAAVLALFSPYPPEIQLWLFVAAHLIASLLLSALLLAVMPHRFVRRRSWVLLLFFTISFFIPVLGGLGLVGDMIYFRVTRKAANRPEYHSLKLPPFLQEGSLIAQGMGEGGAWSRLRTLDLPRPQRLKALLAVSAVGGRKINQLLRLATGDTDDEIRLLAFNLFDRQEKVISQTISDNLGKLRTATNPLQKAEVCRTLALSYWEMVYNDLAQAELQNFFVEQSLQYARQACELGGEEPAMSLLIGRIYLRRGQVEEAEKMIRKALALGALPARTLPYLAEIAYSRRDFQALSEYLRQEPSLRHKPGIGPVAQFWGDSSWQE